jgi:hypothetical protein
MYIYVYLYLVKVTGPEIYDLSNYWASNLEDLLVQNKSLRSPGLLVGDLSTHVPREIIKIVIDETRD